MQSVVTFVVISPVVSAITVPFQILITVIGQSFVLFVRLSLPPQGSMKLICLSPRAMPDSFATVVAYVHLRFLYLMPIAYFQLDPVIQGLVTFQLRMR